MRRGQYWMALVGVVERGETVFYAEAERGGGRVAETFGRVEFGEQAGTQGQQALHPVFGAEAQGVVEAGSYGETLYGLVGEAETVTSTVDLFGDAAVVFEASAAEILHRKTESYAERQRRQKPEVKTPPRGAGQLVAVEVEVQ
jgi:hypothetical protein